jgi:tRNA(fMet)-specific endonuclease VapC
MKRLQAYKFRIEPNGEQARSMRRFAGSCRFVFNNVGIPGIHAGEDVNYAELEYGIAAAENPDKERRNLLSLIQDIPVLPFDDSAGVAYGQIRFATRNIKRDHLDKLIAAHAASRNLIVVTNNVDDFSKYPGITIENWMN